MFTFKRKKHMDIYAPVNGFCINLDDIKDEVFSKKMMGDGCAIIPNTNTVCSPIDGDLILVADTLHAFGVRSNEGIELLIHIGLDTVKLHGEGFHALKTVGTKLKAGTPIISFNSSYLQNDILDMTTVLVLTDNANTVIKEISKGNVKTTDKIMLLESIS